jgi:hypothetical protein
VASFTSMPLEFLLRMATSSPWSIKPSTAMHGVGTSRENDKRSRDRGSLKYLRFGMSELQGKSGMRDGQDCSVSILTTQVNAGLEWGTAYEK